MRIRLAAILVWVMVLGVGVPRIGPAFALSPEDARHLLGRTGFGATAGDVAEFAPLSREAAVQRLLDGVHRQAVIPPPAWTAEATNLYPILARLSTEERATLIRTRIQQAQQLKTWWYQEMLATSSPFTERMTLFWHNHFTSSLRKVRAPHLHYRQNVLLRAEAFGNFGKLLRDIARDPVMLDYLDNRLNRRERPNENFARELLELFTLGEGHYGESDIKEAARAFTGWTTDRDRSQFVVNTRIHDTGTKTVLGRSGNFDGDDVLNIILAQPRTAEFIVEKLWREFISPTPNTAEVARLAAVFRQNRYEIKPLMQALLTSPAFWDRANRGELIKSPVELLVGTVRYFGTTPVEPLTLARYDRRLGQDVFDPPNVKGWPGYTAWITTDTLLVREQFLQRLLRGDALGGGEQRMTPSVAPLPAFGGNDLQTLLLAKPPVNPPPTDGDSRAQIAALMLDPVYQLK